MKINILVPLIGTLLSVSAFAMDCPVHFGASYLDQVQQVIESQKDCAAASAMTEACAMGSSMDVAFVDSALKICDRRIQHASTAIQQQVESAKQLCDQKYSHSAGTLAMSARAFCSLDVSKLYDDLLSPSDL